MSVWNPSSLPLPQRFKLALLYTSHRISGECEFWDDHQAVVTGGVVSHEYDKLNFAKLGTIGISHEHPRYWLPAGIIFLNDGLTVLFTPTEIRLDECNNLTVSHVGVFKFISCTFEDYTFFYRLGYDPWEAFVLARDFREMS